MFESALILEADHWRLWLSSKEPRKNWSYGQNVYFEVDPEYDDYTGSPRIWRKLSSIPKPVTTILHGEVPGSVDHEMVHFWTTPDTLSDLNARRHAGRANYSFADGHVERRKLEQTYAPTNSVDAWNPFTAR